MEQSSSTSVLDRIVGMDMQMGDSSIANYPDDRWDPIGLHSHREVVACLRCFRPIETGTVHESRRARRPWISPWSPDGLKLEACQHVECPPVA
jgi:hypothetical protein